MKVVHRRSSSPRRHRLIVLPVALMAALLALPACASGAGPSAKEPLVMWTLQSEPDRVARTQANLERFTEQSGIEVELVTIDEASVAQSMLTNAASGTLPDLVDHPMVLTSRWAAQDLLDTAAATRVVEALGRDTFTEASLRFAAADGETAAVPMSGWGMLLHYRKDLFAEAGLAPPTSFELILAAARTLHDPAARQYGIVLGTDPGHQVTQQIFEQFALSNGCELINESAELQLQSDRCVEVFDFYATLVRDFGPPGSLGSVEQRAAYLSGQAAMMPQGPFTLHRIANLEDAEPAVCAQCAEDPDYLARNTGLVPMLTGFHDQSAQYGQTSNLGITVDADTEAAEQLARYLLSDGYLEWLAQVPNGMIPARTGTAEDPGSIVEAWQDLEMGVDRTGNLRGVYGDEVVRQVTEGAETLDAWGIPQGQGELVGVLYERYLVPAAVKEVADQTLTAAEAAGRVTQELTAELERLR